MYPNPQPGDNSPRPEVEGVRPLWKVDETTPTKKLGAFLFFVVLYPVIWFVSAFWIGLNCLMPLRGQALAVWIWAMILVPPAMIFAVVVLLWRTQKVLILGDVAITLAVLLFFVYVKSSLYSAILSIH